MFAVDVCRLPATGGSTFVVVASLLMLVAGVAVTRWVRASAGRMSVVVAPLVLLGGLALAPQVTDPCAPTTTVAVTTTTTVAPTTTTVAPTTTTVAPTTTTVAPTTTTTTLAPVVYNVGDIGPGGGFVFFIDKSRAEGSQYFEAACAGWSDGECGGSDLTDPTIEWGCVETIITGADGTAIGIGEQNTADIVDLSTGCPDAGTAAKLADTLVLGGQDDWFLPSKDELNELCKWAFEDSDNAICNANGDDSLSMTRGAFFPGDYWASSEIDDPYATGDEFIGSDSAWTQSFDFGYQGSYTKSGAGGDYVRPVRSF